jgi:hypothetical protein
MVLMEEPNHLLLWDDQHGRCSQGEGGCQTKGMARERLLAEKSPGPSIATTASFPLGDSTASFRAPF